MKKLTAFALIAAAAAGTALAISLWKRSQDDACCRYDSDDFDDDDDCFCEDCGTCNVCDEDLDVEIPESVDEAAEAVEDAADALQEAAEDFADAIAEDAAEAEDEDSEIE